MLKIAILGCGSVGRGIAEAVSKKNLDIKITGLADSKSGIIDNNGININQALKRKKETGACGDRSVSVTEIIKSADYDVLVEVTPTDAITGEPALGYIKTALKRGKHVVTSNKGPVALQYRLLKKIAEENNVLLKYEANTRLNTGSPAMR